MKLIYCWIVAAIAETALFIYLFSFHKSIVVLSVSIALCLLTTAGVIRTTRTKEDRKNFSNSIALTLLGFIIFEAYLNILASIHTHRGATLNLSIYCGIFCALALLADKKQKGDNWVKDTFRNAWCSMLGSSFSKFPEGCLVGFLMLTVISLLALLFSIPLFFISYIGAIFHLLGSKVSASEETSKKIPENDDKNENYTGGWL